MARKTTTLTGLTKTKSLGDRVTKKDNAFGSVRISISGRCGAHTGSIGPARTCHSIRKPGKCAWPIPRAKEAFSNHFTVDAACTVALGVRLQDQQRGEGLKYQVGIETGSGGAQEEGGEPRKSSR